jgi:hypothetical protein
LPTRWKASESLQIRRQYRGLLVAASREWHFSDDVTFCSNGAFIANKNREVDTGNGNL